MTPGRFSKALARRLTVSWRQQPNQHEIEALDANVARVGLVVRVRWAIVAALVVFSVAGAGIYAADGSFAEMWRQMVVPGVSLGFVLLYNTYYQMNYRRFANIAVFNVVQLLLDIVVVTVLIYYSGGVYSWFPAMYLLFVLEAALILPTREQVFAIAVGAWAAYTAVLGLVFFEALPHVAMPFVRNDLQAAASYVAVRCLWELTILGGAAAVGTGLMTEIRMREEQTASGSVRDRRTGLFDRAYFRRELGLELERARRDRRGVSVVLADIDDFERFNTLFGVEAGNAMLVRLTEAITRAVAPSGSPEPQLIVVARWGGEEFVLLVPEASPGDMRDGEAIAERVRVATGDVRDQDRSVTVSVGVATFPAHGRTAAELIGAADSALTAAKAAGGNRVVAGRGGTAEQDDL
jgi:diguanylate cyclase (GGDEF)-like protein